MTAQRSKPAQKKRRPQSAKNRPPEILTFKADSTLVEALRRMPNRSEFIRTAILKAFESSCPFCRGTGTMTTNQRRHWQEFARKHQILECGDCHEIRIHCVEDRKRRASCPAATT